MSQKLDDKCMDCGKDIKVWPQYYSKSRCYDCHATELAKNQGVTGTAEMIKDLTKYEKSYEFQYVTKGQKLAGVIAQGDVFASKGGVHLMLTEFVENAFDALKKIKVLIALPTAIKQMNFTPDFQKIAFEKHTIPITEFNEKYMLTEEQKLNLKALGVKILEVVKSQNKKRSTITIEIDDDKQEIRIIDSGTGIEHPIHICEQPFVSLKTGEDYSTGTFGRGAQVFRVFCELMEFYSIRERPSEREEKNIVADNIDKTKIDTNSIRIGFPWDFPGGKYSFKPTDTYKNLSGNTNSGTVVVLSYWKGDYYSQISKHVKKLEGRLQHHFGFALDDVFNIGLKIKYGKKEIDITKMDFDELSKDDNPSKIQEKFKLPNIQLKDRQGNPCGEVEFHLHKTNRSYWHSYKEPFLIVNGRPLGDTPIWDMPEMAQNAEIWKSSTVTGYVVCNSVIPNQMRIGLADNKAKQPFFESMNLASIDLRKLNTAWKNELSSAQDVQLLNDVVSKVTSFLSKKGFKFSFKNPLEKGIQKDTTKSGQEITDDRVSNSPGGPNQGLIDANDGDEVEVGYRKRKVKTPSGEPWNPNTIIVPHGSNKKDGSTVIKVKVKRSLVSKGGRKIRKSYSGPGLEFHRDEDCEEELSYFEPDPPIVMIQSEHEAWKKLARKAKNQTNSDKFEKEKMDYCMERYLWEIMNQKGVQLKEGMTDKERKDLFWTYYHDLVDTK